MLETEAYLMTYCSGEGIPKVKTFGYSGNFNVMIMELLDKSVEDYFEDFDREFPLKTIVLLAIQMVAF